MTEFIFTTTGLVSIVRFEEIGAYFNHPTSAYTLTDSFDINEITNSQSIQDSIDNGEIIATDENGNIITDLNYLINAAPIFLTDNVDSNISYIGYGELNACKILEVITDVNGNYTSLWSGGDQSFDKIWGNRLLYTYF